MKRSLVMLLALTQLGCSARQPSAQARVNQLMAVWRSGNDAPLDTILADTIVYDDVPNAAQYRGLDEVRAYVGRVHAWAGDVSVEVTRLAGDDKDAVAEWIMRGVQDAPIEGHVPVATNRPFEIHGATIVTLDGSGDIARAVDYMDVLGFVLQLGSEVILPGGVRLGPPAP